jgi:hypothetical protein
MFLKFFVIFAAIVAMMYLTTSTDNKPGVLLLAAVISVVFVILSTRSEHQELRRRRYRMKPNTVCSRGGAPTSAQQQPCPNKFTDTLVASTLPQVDALSRSIDDKMAINQTSNPLYVPGGVNSMFESQLL